MGFVSNLANRYFEWRSLKIENVKIVYNRKWWYCTVNDWHSSFLGVHSSNFGTYFQKNKQINKGFRRVNPYVVVCQRWTAIQNFHHIVFLKCAPCPEKVDFVEEFFLKVVFRHAVGFCDAIMKNRYLWFLLRRKKER